VERIAKHWRMIGPRLCLKGFKRMSPKGVKEVSLAGNSWTELPSSDRSYEEIPSTEITIYQAPALQGKNGGNGHNHESVEISVAMEASVMVD